MAFAIELDLDSVANERIMRLWQQLYAECSGADLITLGATAHVTLAVIPEAEIADLAALVRIVEECSEHSSPIPSQLSAAAAFPTKEGVLFLVPVVTERLLALHRFLHERLAAAAISVNSLYLQQNWIPHCTVALDLPIANMSRAFALAWAADVYGPIQLDAIRLVEFRPVHTHAIFPLIGKSDQVHTM